MHLLARHTGFHLPDGADYSKKGMGQGTGWAERVRVEKMIDIMIPKKYHNL